MIYRSSSPRTEGVSAVVGVIMMVALTVVLAAVLGQFVFGMVSNLEEPPQAGVAFKLAGTDDPGEYNVTAIVTAMPNADEVVIRPESGNGMSFTRPGDSATETYEDGTLLTVLANKGDQSVVVQMYEVGGS